MRSKFLGLIFLTVALSACGGPGIRYSPAGSVQALQDQKPWIIDLTGPTDAGVVCSTGHHEFAFTDKTTYCNALLDATFGGGCAMPQRRGQHVMDCAVPN